MKKETESEIIKIQCELSKYLIKNSLFSSEMKKNVTFQIFLRCFKILSNKS